MLEQLQCVNSYKNRHFEEAVARGPVYRRLVEQTANVILCMQSSGLQHINRDRL